MSTREESAKIGEPVKILAGPYAGATGTLENIDTTYAYSHSVYDRRGEWHLGWYRPQDLQAVGEDTR